MAELPHEANFKKRREMLIEDNSDLKIIRSC